MSELAANPSVKVWYDSDCPLCVREIRLMRRLDTRGAIDFIDLYSAQGCPIDRADLMKRFVGVVDFNWIEREAPSEGTSSPPGHIRSARERSQR